MDDVVGRWRLDRGRGLDHRSSLHHAELIGGDDGDRRFVEVHPIPEASDPGDVVAIIRQASRISDPGLLTIVDVGSSELGGQPVVYLATSAWDEVRGSGPRAEADLLAMARSLAGGLASLHRSYLVHGAVHRGAVRRSDTSWRLGPAGLGPLLETEIAPYRPPGLHVVEPSAPPADLWSLGVVLHEQATGRLIRPGEAPRLPAMAALEALVTDLLQVNPAERPTAEQVVERLSSGATPAPLADTATVDHASAGFALGPVPTTWDEPSPATAAAAGPAPGRVVGSPARAPRGDGRSPLVIGLGLALVAAVIGVAAARLLGGGDDGADGDAVETTGTVEADQSAGTGSEDPTGDNDADESGTTGEDGADEDGAAIGDDSDAADQTTGPIDLGRLELGDCIEVDLTLGDPRTVESVACETPHDAQVVGLVAHQPAADGGYPGRAGLLAEAKPACEQAFNDYVGGEELLTSLFVLPVVPTFGDWNREERRDTVCMAHLFDGSAIEGDLAGRFTGYELVQGSEAPISKLFGGRCFEIDGEIDTMGRRQVVTLIGCENLHRHETISVEPLPLDEEDRDADTMSESIRTTLFNEATEVCQEIWDGFTEIPDAATPTVYAIVPSVLDWQLGDRFMTCTVRWDEETLGSVVSRNWSPPGAEDDE